MTLKVFKTKKGKRGSTLFIKNLFLVTAVVFIVVAVPVLNASFQVIKVSTESVDIEFPTEEHTLDVYGSSSVMAGIDGETKMNFLPPFSPPVTIDMKVRKKSSDPWADSITAPNGTVLQFKIWIKNTKLLYRNVAVVELLPSILDYVSGSADPEPNEYFEDPEESMIWLMKIPGLSTETITFNAKIVEVGNGENYVVVTPLVPGAESDDDSVSITATNTAPNTPSDPIPADGATDIDVDADLIWNCSDPNGDLLTYDVYFDTTSPPTTKVSANQSDNTYNPGTMSIHTNYYWKIVAWDNHNASTSSPIWDFTTENTPPNAPSDPDPPDGATDIDVNTDLSWSCSDPDGDDLTYDVYFGDSSPPPLVSSCQTETTYDPGKMNTSTKYYWKIFAEDEYGAETKGPEWDFTTELNNPPYTPSDPDPEDGATDVDINADLNWSGGDPDPGDTVTYDVYFEYNDSTPDVKVSSNQTETTYDPGTMYGSSTYYWKIISWDEEDESTEGPVWSFSTENLPPYQPSNPTPANNSQNVDINADLNWSGGDPDPEDTVTYDVYFGDSSDPPQVTSNISEETYDPETMEHNTQYYWRIVSWDNHGASKSGYEWDFKTGSEQNEPPYEPSNPNPVDGAVEVDYLDVVLNWTGGDPDPGDTVVYDVYLEVDDPDPTTLVSDDQNETSYAAGDLVPGAHYYWKIVAKDNHGASSDGPIWSFTTGQNDCPEKPNIYGPNGGVPDEEYCWRFTSIDLDDDDLKYYIEWGDGTNTKTDCYPSGATVEECHTYSDYGTYIIKAKAIECPPKDLESDWAEKDVIIPRGKISINTIILRVLQRFPHAFPILRQLLGL